MGVKTVSAAHFFLSIRTVNAYMQRRFVLPLFHLLIRGVSGNALEYYLQSSNRTGSITVPNLDGATYQDPHLVTVTALPVTETVNS